MKTPYVGYTLDQLKKEVANEVTCRLCNQSHLVEAITSDDGEITLHVYRCSNRTLLAGIGNKSIIGTKPAASGKV